MGLLANDVTGFFVLIGSQFSEPTRVVGNPTAGDGFVIVNLVGTRTSTFRGGVTRTKDDLTRIQIERPATRFGGKPRLFLLAALTWKRNPALPVARLTRTPYSASGLWPPAPAPASGGIWRPLAGVDRNQSPRSKISLAFAKTAQATCRVRAQGLSEVRADASRQNASGVGC